MRTLIVRTLTVFSVLLSAHAWAANYSDPIDGIYKGAYGNTITVEVPSLVSKSPVDTQDQNGDLSFELNAATGYRNFNQITDLRDGDSVRIQYTQDNTAKDKQMIATIITKIEPPVTAAPVTTTDGTTTTVTVPASQTVTTTTTSVSAQ